MVIECPFSFQIKDWSQTLSIFQAGDFSSAIHYINENLWNSWSKRKYISPVKRDVARVGLQTAQAFKSSWAFCASMKTFILNFQIKLPHRKMLSTWGKSYLQILRKKSPLPFEFRNMQKSMQKFRVNRITGLFPWVVSAVQGGSVWMQSLKDLRCKTDSHY